ncbi:MAG: response regulator [Deltaproteobacteria bacterium]|nr:response regulator [Deltaproteobacteria bacterium]
MPPLAKILIVDDEPLNVDLLEQELADLGYATVSATRGQEAIEKAIMEEPELILLDVMMPGLDGFAVCRLLKADERTQLIPVVMMTALGSQEDRIRGIEAGADDFLTKPADPRELLARVATALRMKHTIDRRLNALRHVNEHLAKFVPEAVKKLVAANPETPDLALHERDISVMFVDIAGYTHLSEQLSLDDLSALVERYFSAFFDHIRTADGDVNETAGDGFMTIFQDSNGENHARKAVDTALALVKTTTVLNQAGGTVPLAIHIGINSGIALVGSTRFEGLHGTRWTFTASGRVTNLAARLAETAKAHQILVGPETVRRLGNGYQVEALGRQHLKNFTDAIDLHRILGSANS